MLKLFVLTAVLLASLPASAQNRACSVVLGSQSEALKALPKKVREGRLAPILSRYWNDADVVGMVAELKNHEGRFMSRADLGGMSVVFRVKRGKKKTKITVESIQEAGAEWGGRPDRLTTNFVKLITAVLKFSADEKAGNIDRKVVIVADDLANLTLVKMLTDMGFDAENANSRALDQNYELSI